jgi:hypothetical protein
MPKRRHASSPNPGGRPGRLPTRTASNRRVRRDARRALLNRWHPRSLNAAPILGRVRMHLLASGRLRRRW